MSEANPTAADTDDEIDMVAAFLALFGPEPEPEPQPATINWTPPAPVTWTPGGFALSRAQLTATTEPPGLELVFDPPEDERLGVATHTLTAALAPGQNYVAQPKQVQLTVNKIPATIIWNQPAALTWEPGGATPGDLQLDAATDPPGGRIAYIHATAGKLPPGPHRITAQIAEGEPYEAAPVTHTLTVNKAPAEILWQTPAPVPWVPGGFVVSNAQLTASTNPPDLNFTYSGHDGGGLEVGDHTLTATLNEPNYEAAPKSVTLTVTRADPQLSWIKPALRTAWQSDTKVNRNFETNLNNPLGLALTYNPPLGTPLAVARNTISVTAADSAHYEQTPVTFTLNITPAPAIIGLIKHIDVPAAEDGGWKVDVAAIEVRTKPPGLAVTYDPADGTVIYPGQGITVSLDPSVTTHIADPVTVKVDIKFPPKPEPQDTEGEGGDPTHVAKSVLKREWSYGGPNVTPHIHHYGTSYHIKLAGGKRLNLVQKGTIYEDNVDNALEKCESDVRLCAIIKAIAGR